MNNLAIAALPECDRREIFFRLVDLQDQGVAAESSKEFVAGQYGVGLDVLETIEREGMENDWPPLEGNSHFSRDSPKRFRIAVTRLTGF